jgi:hypothetical protein
MTVAYLGFSNICGGSHQGAAHSGIAQSDFTYSLLREITQIKYFVCLDNLSEAYQSNDNIPIILRVGYLKNLLDSIRLFRRLKNESPFKKIIIYHSFIFFPLILFLFVSRRKFILQVNEVFSRAGSHNLFIHFLIEKVMFYLASDFILASRQLSNFLPLRKQKLLNDTPLIPGPIYMPKNITQVKGTINICKLVYAGMVDKIKVGGAFIAIQLALLLDSAEYSIDIYGFGTAADIDCLENQIKACNLESRTKVRYLGSLPHDVLVETLSNYDVGLATQYIGTNFSSSSFPSKILTYLSAGLHAVSASSATVRDWSFSDTIFIYSESNLTDLVSHIKSLGPVDKSISQKNVGLMRDSMLSSLRRLIG